MQFIQHDGSIITITEQQFDQLTTLANLTKQWNGLSLIAKSTCSDIFGWHICEALSIKNLLETFADPIIDFGAGGGIIGMSLAIAGINNILLVERSKTKIQFMKDIAKFENTFATTPNLPKFNLIIRGVDKISNILQIFANEITNKQIQNIILFKAENYINEIKRANKMWRFDYEIFTRQGNAHGKILHLSNIINAQI